MHKKLTEYGKRIIVILYILYVANVIINNAFLQEGTINGLIVSYGLMGYIITIALSLLLSGGFFVISTIIQIILYHIKKKEISNCFIPLIIFEVIKILGTLTYFCMIDVRNINFSDKTLSSVFIVTGIIIFVVTSIMEVTALLVGKYFTKNAA